MPGLFVLLVETLGRDSNLLVEAIGERNEDVDDRDEIMLEEVSEAAIAAQLRPRSSRSDLFVEVSESKRIRFELPIPLQGLSGSCRGIP